MEIYIVIKQYGKLACRTIDKIFLDRTAAENYKFRREKGLDFDDPTLYYLETHVIESDVIS